MFSFCSLYAAKTHGAPHDGFEGGACDSSMSMLSPQIACVHFVLLSFRVDGHSCRVGVEVVCMQSVFDLRLIMCKFGGHLAVVL